MKITKTIIDNAIEGKASNEEAVLVAQWFCSEDGEKEFSARLDAAFSEDTPAEYMAPKRVELIGKSIAEKAFVQGDGVAEKRVADRPNAPRKKQIFFRFLAVAALIPLFFLGGALFQSVWQSEDNYNEICVASGDKATVVLADGSKVELNAGSSLRYPTKFGLFERRVYLKGQAYFNVESEKYRHFIVDLGETNVEVLGTKFDIDAYAPSQQVVVSLFSGSVRFESPCAKYMLKPNERLTFDAASQVSSISKIDGAAGLEWINNILILKGESMAKLLEKMSRQYGVEFKVLDASVMRYTYSLYSDNQRLSELISIIERITPVKFTNKGDFYEVKQAKH